jgi:hypothetical protein
MALSGAILESARVSTFAKGVSALRCVR